MLRTTVIGLLLLAGCEKKNTSEPTGDATPPPTSDTPPPSQGDAERPSMTAPECEAKGGTVVGDIGDGAIHRPDYTCESGKPPIGSVRAAEGAPVAIEGQVCCPAAS